MKKYIAIGALVLVVALGGVHYFFAQTDGAATGDTDGADTQVYETDAQSARECASFETYDSKRKVCSFECKSDEECADLQQKANDEFSGWADELQKDDTPVAEKKLEDSQGQKASYHVSPTETITLKSGVDDPEYRTIWNSIKSLSPDALSDSYIETYEVYDSPGDDTLAFVDDDDSNGKWRISINLAGYHTSSERENKTTIIHELGHIISLNASQVNPSATKCANLQLDEGCANKDSAINVFWNNYWKGVSRPTYTESAFVDEYATTDVTEDFAETFAFFVLEKDTGLGTSVRDQKIQMMYSFPELVAIRTQMRNTLSKELIRARR